MMRYELIKVDGKPVRDPSGKKLLLRDQLGNDVFIDEALISFEPEAPQEAPNSTLQKKSAETKQNAEVEEKFWSRSLAKPEEFNSLPVTNVQELLIKIFGDPKIQQLFKDTVTRKSKVWELVAESLQKAGYPLPQKGPRSPGKQCDDKWRQMKAQYYKHKNPKTGEGAKTPLPYYDLVDSIIGGDQLTSPKHTRDTLNSSNNSRSSETAAAPSPSNSVEQPQQNLFGDSDSEEDADTPPDPQTTAEVDRAGSSNSNIHKGRGKKRIKPVTGNQRVMIEMMEKKAKMIEKLAENRLKVLQDMHKEDNETTRELIDVMKEALKSKNSASGEKENNFSA